METRRGFLGRGLFGGALLALAGAVPLALTKSKLLSSTPPLRFFSAAEYAIVHAVAERMVPGGEGWAPASALGVAEKLDLVMDGSDVAAQKDMHQLLMLFDNALIGLLFDARPRAFTALDAEAQLAALESWRSSRLTLRRSGFVALRGLVMATYYGDPASWEGVGYPGPPEIVR
jgi:hypothetical protein